MDKVRIQIGKVWIECECESVKESMAKITEYSTVYGQKACGMCGSENIYPEHRTDAEGNNYYSMRCGDCPAQFSFGQTKAGGVLFPRREDPNGNKIPNNGWYDWRERVASKERYDTSLQQPPQQQQPEQRQYEQPPRESTPF